jgi:hypothetical protein
MRAGGASGPTAAATQSRAVRALAMVSAVVKVLEAMTNSVRRGSSRRATSAKCAPSTLETKCVRGPSASAASARAAITGPRSEPPMPILTTSVNGPSGPA